MRGSHDSSEQGDGNATPIPARAAGSLDPLERAATGWMRRGYTVRYRDTHLVQLVRASRPGCGGALLIALALPVLALAVLLVVLGARRRRWHTVSLTITPEQRVITHRQWAPHPPES
ncbi:MAG: hypothetical protein IVW57_05385 [Ktedonobacterales bacterium]|nr:hypothetical protein [Ktedonobacterales bacterium]